MLTFTSHRQQFASLVPYHALLSFSATCKTNCAGNFTTNYSVSAKSPGSIGNQKPGSPCPHRQSPRKLKHSISLLNLSLYTILVFLDFVIFRTHFMVLTSGESHTKIVTILVLKVLFLKIIQNKEHIKVCHHAHHMPL